MDKKESLIKLNKIREYRGGDYDDIPMNQEFCDIMQDLIEKCDLYDIEQPEIFPHYDARGIQAEWEYDWYIEIDIEKTGISILIVQEREYDRAITCSFKHVDEALLLVKIFLDKVVDKNGSR